jgi:hypothetical protein
MKNFYYNLHILHSRLSAHLSKETHLHKARFAYDHELAPLSRPYYSSSSLLLGLDRFNHVLQVTPTPQRPKLGNLMDVGPSQCGKSTHFVRQLHKWGYSVIANDIKGDLSRETAEFRRLFSDVYFIDPTGWGHRHDPLIGKNTEDEFYLTANLLLYEAQEKDPIFTQRATKILTLLFLLARITGNSPFPFVGQIARLGLNTAVRRVNDISPAIATRLLDGEYNSNTDYNDNQPCPI